MSCVMKVPGLDCICVRTRLNWGGRRYRGHRQGRYILRSCFGTLPRTSNHSIVAFILDTRVIASGTSQTTLWTLCADPASFPRPSVAIIDRVSTLNPYTWTGGAGGVRDCYVVSGSEDSQVEPPILHPKYQTLTPHLKPCTRNVTP